MKDLARLARIRALARDPKLRLEELEDCIAAEPRLASEVVRIADSALCGMQGRIHSLTRALLILGAEEVCAIAALVLVRRELRAAGDGAWLHCLEIAVASQLVSRRLDLGLDSEAFLAGLLHELREAPRATTPALAALLRATHALLADAPVDVPIDLDLYPDDGAAVRAGVAARLKLLSEIV
jgi:HD-like signal output (HDOD) protein